MTRRQWIYQIKERLRATSADARVSNRMISQQLDITLNLLIRRDSDTRNIYKQTNLFVNRALTFQTQGNRSISVDAVPAVYQGRYNPFMQLFAEDGTPFTLSSTLRMAGEQGHYAWLDNDHVVVARPGITNLTGRFWFKPIKDSVCQSELDVSYIVPDHLENDLLVAVVQQLAIAPMQIPEDTYANQNSLDRQSPKPAER